MAQNPGSREREQAQRSPGTQKPASPSEIKVTSRVLQVSVLAHDKDGNPVTNLGQGDFTIYDNGHPQPIQYFNIISGTLPSAPHLDIPPGFFTNDPARNAGVPANVVIILVDALNTPYNEQVYANHQLWAYLRKLKPVDHVAIYTLGEKLQILQDFTTDDAALIKAAEAYQGQRVVQQDAANPNGSVLTAKGDSTTNPVPYGNPMGVPRMNGVIYEDLLRIRHMDESIEVSYTVNRVDTTLNALRAIAAHVAGIPGRKNLIWLSGGFPLAIGTDAISERQPDEHPTDVVVRFDAMERTLRALDDANVAVYPVDTRGLIAPDLQSPRYLQQSGGGPTGSRDISDTLMTMDHVAESTGGKAYYNTNGIERSLTRASDDAATSYVLGYSLATTDGKFHKLKVAVDRKGVSIRARQGYFAIPAAPYSFDQQYDLVQDAEESPLDWTGLPLIVEANLTHSAIPEVSISVRIYGNRIRFLPQDQYEVATIDYAFVQRDGAGHIVKRTGAVYNLRLDAADYQTAMGKGLVYRLTSALDLKAAEVRIVACDASTGALGSVTIPLAELAATNPSSRVPAPK